MPLIRVELFGWPAESTFANANVLSREPLKRGGQAAAVAATDGPAASH